MRRGRSDELAVEDRSHVRVWGDHDDPRWTRLRRRLHTATSSFYISMLWQDIQNGLIPFRAIDNGYRVVAHPDDSPDLRQLVAEALDGDRYGHDLEDALKHFLEEAVVTLLLYGRAAYEAVSLVDANGKKAGLRFEQIPAGTLNRRFGKYRQYVPRQVDDQGVRHRSRWVTVDGSRLVVIELPRRQRQDLARMFTTLEVAGWWSSAMSNLQSKAMREQLPYNFAVHNRDLDLGVARATRPVGWDARGTFKDRVLEPYQVWRLLQFARTKISLRDFILSALNERLPALTAPFGWKATLAIAGLRSVQDVHRAEEQLAAGTVGMDDLVREFM